MGMRVLLVILILWGGCCSSEWLYVSSSASNTHSSCTETDPCATIKQALSVFDLAPSTIFQVYIAPGSYSGSENVNITFNVPTILHQNKEGTDAGTVRFIGTPDVTCFASAGDLTVDGISIEGCSTAINIKNGTLIVSNSAISGTSFSSTLLSASDTLSMSIANSSLQLGTVRVIGMNQLSQNDDVNSSVIIENSQFNSAVLEISNFAISMIDRSTFNQTGIKLEDTSLTNVTSSVFFASGNNANSASLSVKNGNLKLNTVSFDANDDLQQSAIIFHNDANNMGSLDGNNITINNYYSGIEFYGAAIVLSNIEINNANDQAFDLSISQSISISSFNIQNCNSSMLINNMNQITIDLQGGVISNSGCVSTMNDNFFITGTISNVTLHAINETAFDLGPGDWSINVNVTATIANNVFLFHNNAPVEYTNNSILFDACEVNNLTIINNFIFVQVPGAYVTVSNCQFIGNHNYATPAGALVNVANISQIQVTGCNFISNVIESVHVQNVLDVLLSGNNFNANTGLNIVRVFDSEAVVNSCTFTSNNQFSTGVLELNNLWSESSAVITNTTVEWNVPLNGICSGILIVNVATTVSNCTFHKNLSTNGGGMYVSSTRNLNVTSSSFISNSGAGLFLILPSHAPNPSALNLYVDSLQFSDSFPYAIWCADDFEYIYYTSPDSVAINGDSNSIYTISSTCHIFNGPTHSHANSLIVAIIFMLLLLLLSAVILVGGVYTWMRKKTSQPLDVFIDDDSEL